MTVYMGVDPGLDGAIAFYEPADKERKGFLIVYDMPTVTVERGGSIKRDVDEQGLKDILFEHEVALAAVERVGPMPKQGVTSVFSFGVSYGMLKGALAAFEVPTIYVLPRTWQKELGLKAGGGKNPNRALAAKLHPTNAGLFVRVKDDGRADAALIAYWAAAGVAGDRLMAFAA